MIILDYQNGNRIRTLRPEGKEGVVMPKDAYTSIHSHYVGNAAPSSVTIHN